MANKSSTPGFFCKAWVTLLLLSIGIQLVATALAAFNFVRSLYLVAQYGSGASVPAAKFAAACTVIIQRLLEGTDSWRAHPQSWIGIHRLFENQTVAVGLLWIGLALLLALLVTMKLNDLAAD